MTTNLQRAALLGFLTWCSTARAQELPRVQVDQRGDFLLAGNTLGWDCASWPDDAPSPIVGDAPLPFACGLNADDSSIDVFWRADAPFLGAASASLTNLPGSARSSSFVALPAGAEVTYAFLYWAARRYGASADTSVTVERPLSFSQNVTALRSYTVPLGNDVVYQSVADVTSLVRTHGRGVYRVSGVDVQSLPSTNEDVLFAGWTLVVLYKLDSEPPRNLAIFDGLADVAPGRPASVQLSGFLVPTAGFDAKLGAIVYEGDDINGGDSLLFGQAPLDDGDRLSDALNPVSNFFNGTRSRFGAPVSQAGDLPQLNGRARSMAGLDLDVVDVTSRLTAGQTSVDVQATSSLDHYFLGAFVTSISTFRPDFSSSTKSVRDVDGGMLLPGDQLEYTIEAINSGNDASKQTVLTDMLPTGVTLVPGSVRIDGATKTEASDGDAVSYDAATRTLTIGLGSIASGGRSVVAFLATVDANASGVIANQAVITASGERGAPSASTPTDGDVTVPGASSTDIPVAGCTSQQCMCALAGGDCLDSDADGVPDADEATRGTDPRDADSDDDGVPDGAEKPTDSDGDGLIDALDPDSDNDGLYDGTEAGYGCSLPSTNLALMHCIPDADPSTQTDPTVADTDGGGALDGNEDSDRNGRLDAGERDPTLGHGADDFPSADTDGDGLSDAQEGALGSNPRDRDSDDDGLRDGEERNPADDSDGDGLINILDPDSDNDGLFDGTEAGKDCVDADTKPGSCRPDGDAGATTTSPVVADTDGGGASDGSEDSNGNGVLDPGERDPTLGHAADDSEVSDSDGDGLSDDTEIALGSDPRDADTDDDGVRDGDEANRADDTDRDGKINVLDPDSDGDGLGDGTERGSLCNDPATNVTTGHCSPDADGGTTTTFMVSADTDRGGVWDGLEDANRNGKIDPGEHDPNDASDDVVPAVEPLDASTPQAPDAYVPPSTTTIDSPITGLDAGAFDGGGLEVTVTGGGCNVGSSRGGFGLLLALFLRRRRR